MEKKSTFNDPRIHGNNHRISIVWTSLSDETYSVITIQKCSHAHLMTFWNLDGVEASMMFGNQNYFIVLFFY